MMWIWEDWMSCNYLRFRWTMYVVLESKVPRLTHFVQALLTKCRPIKPSVLFYHSIKFLFGYPWMTNNQLIWPPLFIYVHMMCLILRPICQENEKLCFVLPLSTRSSSCATISEWVQHVLTIKIEEGTHCIVVPTYNIHMCLSICLLQIVYQFHFTSLKAK